MGIEIICDNIEYSCSYDLWNLIRMELLNATLLYLENILLDTKLDKERSIEISCILYYKNDMLKSIDDFLNIMNNKKDFINQFIFYEIYGVYVLLNKSDYDGLYSPGNSIDIIKMIDKTYFFISNDIVLERIEFFIKPFKNSIEKKLNIFII